jgi:hypothetical protein
MKHPIHRVTSFEVVGEYTLRVGFDDQTSQVINFEPVLKGEVYGHLRERAVFRQVAIDTECQTLVWPNGADFDPGLLHDWSERAEAMADLARSWSPVSS